MMTVMPQQTQMFESVVSAVFIQEPHLHHGRGPISNPHGSAHISLARTRIMVLSNCKVARRICSHSYYISNDNCKMDIVALDTEHCVCHRAKSKKSRQCFQWNSFSCSIYNIMAFRTHLSLGAFRESRRFLFFTE